MLLYSTTDIFNLNLDNVNDANAAVVYKEFTNVSVYKSKSIFAPVISDTGNNFLLNEPIIEGIKNPYTLLMLPAAAVKATLLKVDPNLQLYESNLFCVIESFTTEIIEVPTAAPVGGSTTVTVLVAISNAVTPTAEI